MAVKLDLNYNMYQLGYDKADNAKSTYGFALESGTGHADYNSTVVKR